MYIIIRGPLGVGKTTVSEELAKRLKGIHVSIDAILDEHDLQYQKAEDGFISDEAFLRANTYALPKITKTLQDGRPVIIDGNFYRKRQIEDLIKTLPGPYQVFTLHAPLEDCITRDTNRDNTHGPDAAMVVYNITMSFSYGTQIETAGRTRDDVVDDILGQITNT